MNASACPKWLFIAFIGISASTFAQLGRLEGRVTDTAGEPIASAWVVATCDNCASGYLETYTNANGQFRFLALPLDQYRIETMAAGYNDSVCDDIDSGLQSAVRVKMWLEEGAECTTVVSSYCQPMIESRSTGIRRRYATSSLKQLPF